MGRWPGRDCQPGTDGRLGGGAWYSAWGRALPTQHTRECRPITHGWADLAGTSIACEPSGFAGTSQDDSAEVSKTDVSLPPLTFKHDHPPLHEIPPPECYERDRAPDRSRSPVRKSWPTGRTYHQSQRYSCEESSESSSRSRLLHSSRSPGRCPDSLLDFRAAIQSEETAKSSSVSNGEDDGGSSKKVSSMQYELFSQAVMSSKGSFTIVPGKTKRAARASLLDLGEEEKTDNYWISAKMRRQTECRGWTSLPCLTRWCLQPESRSVWRTKNLWRKQHFLRRLIQTARLSSILQSSKSSHDSHTGRRYIRMHSTRPNHQPWMALGIGNCQPTSRSRRRWPWILKNWQEDLPFTHH